MSELRDSIIEYTTINHPELKKTSVKFKRKCSEYGREVIFYKL